MKHTARILLAGLFCLSSLLAAAQTGVGNCRPGFRQEGNTIYFSADHATVRVAFCTAGMFRTTISWNGRFPPDEHWMVTRYDWPPVKVKVVEERDRFVLRTGELVVTIARSPFSVTVATPEGRILSSGSNTAGRGGSFQQGDEVYCRKVLLPDEHFFGFGERMDFMDQRGKKIRLNVGRGEAHDHRMGAYNVLKADYCPVPFFMSTRGYGIFFHNAYPTEWDMGSSDPHSYTFKAEGGFLDYYFIYGPGFPAILEQYTALTGRSPLLPRFALGLQVGTYSGGTWGHEELTSVEYVLALVRRFREMGIPLDILFLDSTWRLFGKNGGKGATTFEWRDTFKDPEAMFDSLYAMHIKMVGLHIRPRLDNGRNARLLDEARAAGVIYPEKGRPGEFPDYFDTVAVNWWWQHAAMKVASIGARFFKTDEGSAFGAKANESDKTGPAGREVQRLHNLFPIAYAKAPFEKFMRYNHMRGMNQTREGYAGIQRYPYIFAGDWPSEWQYFAPVIKGGLNTGLSGIGYWAHCMGGFEQPADPELYIRWCQFGLLSPIAMLFGMDHPGYKEPWNYGDTALKIFSKYDRLRYRLIPYLYTAAREMYKTGMPVMRPLVLAYQDDHNVYDIADQYLLGDHMMVCPVTTKGAGSRVVYLPGGTWFDYYSGKEYNGKQYINVLTPLDQIPVFIKGGGIIPMQPAMNYTGERPLDTLTLDVFPHGSSSFSLYEDDGRSLDYQKGVFALTRITCNREAGNIRLHIYPPAGSYTVPRRAYKLKIHTGKAPASVTVASGENSGKAAAGYYDEDNQVLYVRPEGGSSREILVEIHG